MKKVKCKNKGKKEKAGKQKKNKDIF